MVNQQNNKIVIIACWMGMLPDYFPLWMRSCEQNPSVDFLLYTDQKILNPPQNFKVIPSTLAGIRSLAEGKLKMPVTGLLYPYKLCDLRPFYGLVFEDDLKQYTHWAHCDIDLIFGSFETFVTGDLLNAYDKIFRFGHLIIYRNEKEVNMRPVLAKGGVFSAAEVLSSNEHFSYDEITGIDRIYRKNKWPYYTEKPFVDISVRHQKAIRLNDWKKNFSHQAFAWENGHVFRYYFEDGTVKKDEWLYIHFQKKKLPIKGVADSHNAFWITPMGFIPKFETVVTPGIIAERNPILSEAILQEEERAYKSNKIREISKKTMREKIIYIKQRATRIIDKLQKC